MSYGFEALKEHEEPIADGFKRRFVDEMNLTEVSIIDEQRIPCYVGTSIETRADKISKIEYRGRTVSAFYPRDSFLETGGDTSQREPERRLNEALDPGKIDYSQYERIIAEISK